MTPNKHKNGEDGARFSVQSLETKQLLETSTLLLMTWGVEKAVVVVTVIRNNDTFFTQCELPLLLFFKRQDIFGRIAILQEFLEPFKVFVLLLFMVLSFLYFFILVYEVVFAAGPMPPPVVWRC